MISLAQEYIKLLNGIHALGINYALLNDLSGMHDFSQGDIDIVVASEDSGRLKSYLFSNFRVAQVIENKQFGLGFIMLPKDSHISTPIILDIYAGVFLVGKLFFKESYFLEGKELRNNFWSVSLGKELSYLLLKRAEKNSFEHRHRQRVEAILNLLKKEEAEEIAEIFGKSASLILGFLHNNEWGEVMRACVHRNYESFVRNLKFSPFWPVRYCILRLRWALMRLAFPTGLFVVVLGPDGIGKSALISNLRSLLEKYFRGSNVYHFRPQYLYKHKTEEPVYEPYKNKPYNYFFSFLKIVFYTSDYCLGYLFNIRLALIHSRLTLFDRYYDDLLVDPERYRIKNFPWLIKLFKIFVPKPNLFLILDAPAETILSRKSEIASERLRILKERYGGLIFELQNSFLINGAKPQDEVANEACWIIVGALEERSLNRFKVRYGEKADCEISLIKRILPPIEKNNFVEGKKFRLIKLSEGRAWLLPADKRRLSLKGLELYNPQNKKAKLVRNLFYKLIHLGLSRYLPCRIVELESSSSLKEVSFLGNIKSVLGRDDLEFAISCGSSGIYRKPIIQVMSGEGKILSYVKLGWNDCTKRLVRSEARALNVLQAVKFNSFLIPQIIHCGDWGEFSYSIQTSRDSLKENQNIEFNDAYLNILKELSVLKRKSLPLEESNFWAGIKERSGSIINPYYKDTALRCIVFIGERFENNKIFFHFSHGDFVPWNIKISGDRPFIFDWEYSQEEAPFGFDLSHFFIQAMLHLHGDSPQRVFRSLKNSSKVRIWFDAYFSFFGESVEFNGIKLFVLLYLLERISSRGQYGFVSKYDFYEINNMVSLANLLIS